MSDLDGMFAAMGDMEDAANARLTPGQIRLRDAVDETVYWVRAIPDWDLVIYGVVPPNAETQEGAGFDVDENRKRGYLTGVAYSTAEGEDGAPGDTHVAEVIAITAETFEVARSLGFPDYSQLRLAVNMPLGRLLAAHERETLGEKR
jgi:hypothetical protein